MKRFFTFVAIFCMLCSSVWAFPGRWNKSESLPVAEVQATQEELPAPVEEEKEEALPAVVEETPKEVIVEIPVAEVSENTPDTVSIELLKILTDYENESRLNKAELEQLISRLETIRDEYEIICEDLDAKEIEIADLEALNAQQADDLAYIRGAYDKESGIKAFANVGAVIGFKDLMPTWGLSSELGMRVGNGFLMSLGAQYMFGTFTEDPLLEWSLDNMAITASFGWEW